MPSIAQTIDLLNQIAPLELAEDWDNVGELLAPLHQKEKESTEARIFLCIDLTESVLEEAFAHNCNLIAAYHPPFFTPKKRFSVQDRTDRMMMHIIRKNCTVYSPHTALDAAEDGMTDWLRSPFLSETKSCRAITPKRLSEPVEKISTLPSASESQNLSAPGMGRFIELDPAVSFEEALMRIQNLLKLNYLRTVHSPKTTHIRSIGFCPGAGGGLFTKLNQVDLLITGEMRHHDILMFKEQGTHLILCEHTGSERGYLSIYANRLQKAYPDMFIHISKLDQEPLTLATTL